MDAQGRGRADDIDPADQWVLNPSTGEYELRLSSFRTAVGGAGPRRAAARSGGGQGDGGRVRAVRVGGHRTPGRSPERCRDPGVGGARPRRTRCRAAGAAGAGQEAQEVDGARGSCCGRAARWPSCWSGARRRGYLYYQHLNDNIQTIPDDGAGTGGFSKDRAINLLVIGTDKRTGAGNEELRRQGQRRPRRHHDPAARLQGPYERDRDEHPARHDRGRPGLPDRRRKTAPRRSSRARRTSASTRASARTAVPRAAPCARSTELTGIKPDHFMVADFNAVKTLTTAIGGVEVCLAKDINDSESQAGPHRGQAHHRGRAGAGVPAHPATASASAAT